MTHPIKSMRLRSLSLLAVLFGLVSASVQAAPATPVPESESPGSVIVFPAEGEAMPELTAILTILKEAGYVLPGHQAEFVEGRRLFPHAGDDPVLFAPPEHLQKCAGESRPADLAADLKQVEQEILLTNFEQASKRLERIRAGLPCLEQPVDPALLYRSYFLQGVARFFLEKPEDARRWFQLAQGIDQDREWDKSYPPPAWELFLEARGQQVARPPATFRRLLPEEMKVWIDGKPVDGVSPVQTGQGEHLVQVMQPARGEGPARWVGWLLETHERHTIPTWLTDQEHLNGAIRGFGVEDGNGQTMLVDQLTRWGRAKERDWILAVMMGPAVTKPRVIYLDMKEGKVAPAPAWMKVDPSSAEPVFTLPEKLSGKRVPVPRALYGWHLAAGGNIQQVFRTGSTARLIGLEVGGFRRITGPWDARVGLGVGSILSFGAYVSLHLGVRHSWEIDRFGLYAEGGLVGFKWTDDVARLGLEARGGAYYKIDPDGRNSIEFYVGGAFVSVPAGIAQFGLNYERAF